MLLNTVLGEIKRESLGVVAPHEHILIDLTGFFNAMPVKGCDDPAKEPVQIFNLGILYRHPYALRDNLLLDDIEMQKKEIIEFKKAGGKTIVDVTSPGIGRDPLLLKNISLETGINIVMGTGYYIGSTHPKRLETMTEKDIADEMVRELTIGVDDSGIRAGIIGEIGISEKFDDRERRVLRAAALAQLETGVAIHVHINPWTTNGLEAADILIDMGVSPSRICICHIDVENREEYIFKLLDKGVFIEFDNFGKEYYVQREARNEGYGIFAKDTERVALLKRIINRGHIDQVLLSCDVCLKILLHSYGGWGYDHILTNIVPMMEDEGITDKQIKILLQKNAADFLLGRV